MNAAAAADIPRPAAGGASPRLVLWTASLSHALIHVFELAVPALLLPIQREFGAGDFALGRIVTLYSLAFGLGALPAGWLADRWGSRRLLVACLWGAAVSVVGMALSPDLAIFGVAAACMGLSLSIYHPAGTAWISHALPASGRVFAVHGMAGNLGVAGASVIAGTLGALFGWRWALGLLALLGFALGARVLDVPSPPVEIDRRTSHGGGQRSSFILLLVAVAFMGMVYRGMTTFLPKLFALTYADATAGGTAFGGLLTTLALMVGLAGMWVSGRMSDGGAGMTRVFLIGAVMQAPALVLMGWAGSLTLLPLAMIVAFFHFFTQPPGNQMVASFTPPELRGVGYGLFFFVSFGVGSLGAMIGGWASERAGLAPTFSYLALLLVPAVIAVVTLEFVRRPRAAGA